MTPGKRVLLLLLLIFGLLEAKDNPLISLAVNNPARPDFDRERDINRKPQQVLRFFDVRPGMSIYDVFSGGGYYTELLSYSVGPQGKVFAHNNPAYLEYMQDQLSKRFVPGRLNNVQRITAEANHLTIDSDSQDMIFLILAYHDIYYAPKSSTWPIIDRDDFLIRLYKGLKPGGTLAVIDHHAAAGSPATSGNTLHRIDIKLVKKELSDIGFILVDEASFLSNSQDDLSQHMYAPEIRGRTSRFILKFTKPKIVD